MAFPSDGRNHHNAVSSESNLVIYKIQLENIYNKEIERIEHLGGTTNKADNILYFKDGTAKQISLKQKKKGLNVGSFDYINTSSFEVSNFKSSFEIYENYKGSKNRKYASLLKTACSNDLLNITDDMLTDFFIKNVVDKYKDIDLLIIDGKQNVIHKVVPSVFNFVKMGGKLTIYDNGKNTQSKQVFVKTKDGLVNLFNLRVRFHLNNGNSKWLGLNKGTSNLVIKFQQDKVGSLI